MEAGKDFYRVVRAALYKIQLKIPFMTNKMKQKVSADKKAAFFLGKGNLRAFKALQACRVGLM